MASDSNPLGDRLDTEDRRRLFNEMDYGNMHGVRREVRFPGSGQEVKVRHGFAFTPSLGQLTVRQHLAQDDTGMVQCVRADAEYVYLRTPRAGTLHLEITHPPRS